MRVRGSKSMTHTILLYAQEFSIANPGCNVVVSGGISDTGMSLLMEGSTEVAMVSTRPDSAILAEAKAKGLEIRPAVVSWGGVSNSSSIKLCGKLNSRAIAKIAGRGNTQVGRKWVGKTSRPGGGFTARDFGPGLSNTLPMRS